jgi:uncharacterized membrane protein
MGFFAMMFLFFIVMRMMHGRRHHFTRLSYCASQRQRHLRARPFCGHHVPVTEAPKPNAYEGLKQRYVRGDIDVEQYERELDEMLRSPEGKRFVN